MDAFLPQDPWRSFLPQASQGAEEGPYRVRSRRELASLTEQLGSIASGTTVLVLGDRRSLRSWVTSVREPGRPPKHPSIATYRSSLQEAGVRVVAAWLVWPTCDDPRVLLGYGRIGHARWAQRSGVLAGGGELPPVRWSLRTRAMLRPLRGLAGGVAILGETSAQ